MIPLLMIVAATVLIYVGSIMWLGRIRGFGLYLFLLAAMWTAVALVQGGAPPMGFALNVILMIVGALWVACIREVPIERVLPPAPPEEDPIDNEEIEDNEDKK